jgi:lactate dehydrogenase-like 2-hydroxyacid dehydrogenase
LITTPFHPGYLTADLISKAKNLKLCITAGVGSDHIDLNAAVEKKIQVLEASPDHPMLPTSAYQLKTGIRLKCRLRR